MHRKNNTINIRSNRFTLQKRNRQNVIWPGSSLKLLKSSLACDQQIQIRVLEVKPLGKIEIGQ